VQAPVIAITVAKYQHSFKTPGRSPKSPKSRARGMQQSIYMAGRRMRYDCDAKRTDIVLNRA
jgi:hypothetical protein